MWKRISPFFPPLPTAYLAGSPLMQLLEWRRIGFLLPFSFKFFANKEAAIQGKAWVEAAAVAAACIALSSLGYFFLTIVRGNSS